MESEKGSQDLIRGALILTVAALVTKILSAMYRVPFQNIVGDMGFYIYQQVYPFYGIILVLSAQGFPVVISKLYKEQLSLGNRQNATRLLAISLFFLSLIGLVFFFIFFLGADPIASLMGDQDLATLFRIMAFPFLLFPFTSVFRGYFQGGGNMVPTAVSQVGEQLIRVVTILLLSYIFVRKGFSLYVAGSGAVFGSVTGGLVGLSILSFYFLRSTDGILQNKYGFKDLANTAIPVMKALLIQGFAISVSGMVLILLQLADALNLYQLLASTEMTIEEAKITKGIFDRGQPLIQLGTVVATAIALSLVPAISGEKQQQKTIENVRISLQLSLLVGSAAAIGLFSIIEPTNIMLFQNANGSAVLGQLSLLILPGSMIITIIGILQGMNHTLFPAIIVLAGFGLKYLLNFLFIPNYGVSGAAVASITALVMMLIIVIMKLRAVMKQRILSTVFILKVLLVSGAMGIFLHCVIKAVELLTGDQVSFRMLSSIQALVAVALGAVFYLILVIKTRLLGEKELVMLPFGSKLLFLVPKDRSR